MDYFKGLAFGVLHIPKSDFMIMTPFEITLAFEQWIKVEEGREKREVERVRQICHQIYCTIPMKNHVSIDTYWPLREKDDVVESKDEREKKYEWLKKQA